MFMICNVFFAVTRSGSSITSRMNSTCRAKAQGCGHGHGCQHQHPLGHDNNSSLLAASTVSRSNGFCDTQHCRKCDSGSRGSIPLDRRLWKICATCAVRNVTCAASRGTHSLSATSAATQAARAASQSLTTRSHASELSRASTFSALRAGSESAKPSNGYSCWMLVAMTRSWIESSASMESWDRALGPQSAKWVSQTMDRTTATAVAELSTKFTLELHLLCGVPLLMMEHHDRTVSMHPCHVHMHRTAPTRPSVHNHQLVHMHPHSHACNSPEPILLGQPLQPLQLADLYQKQICGAHWEHAAEVRQLSPGHDLAFLVAN